MYEMNSLGIPDSWRKYRTIFAFFFVLPQVIAEIDHENENVCLLYTSKNFSEDAVLSLRPSIKVFETTLVFHLPSFSTGVNISSVKITKPGCSIILCNGKHMKGECAEIAESTPDISTSKEVSSKVYQNVLSVDCHCTESEEGDPKSSPKTAGDKLESLAHRPCATLFRDWHFKGQKHPVLFPGSAGKIDLGASPPQLRSASVKNGCNVMVWGPVRKFTPGLKLNAAEDVEFGSFLLNKSVSFLDSDSFNISNDWACCYCDECSESVCKMAHSSSSKLPRDAMMTLNGDFSQFVKHGKKIVGIGRNYRWKKVELAQVLSVPKEPIVFLKPTTSYITEGEVIELPKSLGTIFYELELGIVIGREAKNVSESEALDYVAGYFLALDMTAKEFIKGRGNESRPWEIGKGFDTACPVGEFIPKSFISNPNDLHLECKVNGEVTQDASTSEMIFSVQKLISYVSRYMRLEPFDTILTGTPDGFGPVKDGDVIEGRLGNFTSIVFTAFLSND